MSSLVSRKTPMSRTVGFSCATDPQMLMMGVSGQDDRKRMASVLSLFNRSMLSDSHRLRSSTHSARWKKDYSPDICLVTCYDEQQPKPHFPNSQRTPSSAHPALLRSAWIYRNLVGAETSLEFPESKLA